MMDVKDFMTGVLGTFAELGGHYDFRVALDTLEEVAGDSYTRLRELHEEFLEYVARDIVPLAKEGDLPFKGDIVALVYEFLLQKLAEELEGVNPWDFIEVYPNYAATLAAIYKEGLNSLSLEERTSLKEALQNERVRNILSALGILEELEELL